MKGIVLIILLIACTSCATTKKEDRPQRDKSAQVERAGTTLTRF